MAGEEQATPDAAATTEQSVEQVLEQAAEAAQETAETPEAPAAPVEESEAEQLRRQLEKAQNDLKAAQGRNRPSEEIRQLRADFNELKSTYGAVLKALAPEEAATAEAEGRAARMRTNLWEQLHAAVQDDDGTPVLDLMQAPELEDVRRLWDEARDANDYSGMASAVVKAASVKGRFVGEKAQGELKAAQEALAAAKKEAEEREKKAEKRVREEMGYGDLSAGRPAAGAGPTEQELVNRLALGKQMTIQEMAQARQAMDKGIYPKTATPS